MIKIVRASKYWLLRQIRMGFAVEKAFLGEEEIVKRLDRKPYQVLLESSIEMTPKLPSPSFLRALKARGITQLMAGNHALKHEGVLQAHIQCLFVLISRLQLSIEGVAIFVEKVYKLMLQLQSNNPVVVQDATKSSLFYLMKPQLLTKMVKIAQGIEYFYNEYLRILIVSFAIKAISYSDSNYKKRLNQLEDLNNLKKQVYSKKIVVLDDDNVLTPENIASYVEATENQIKKAYPILQFYDFLNGFEYILSNGYYNQEVLKIGSIITTRQGHQMADNFNLVVNLIKTLVSLERYQSYKIIANETQDLFGTLYNKAVDKYFQLLQNNRTFLEALHVEQATIQTGLVIEFLRKEHRQKAKVVYMKAFKKIFDNIQNGSLLCDIKKIRGIFQIILIMFTHEDKAEVHEFLRQVQRTMTIYPLYRFERLETHCSVAEKYHFKSDVFAEQFFKYLLTIKNKIEKNRRLISSSHQSFRQIHLADRLLTYLKIAQKPSKENQSEAEALASSLAQSNILFSFMDTESMVIDFLSSTSFANPIFFFRSSILNLTSVLDERKKIEGIMNRLQIKSVNKFQSLLTREIVAGFNKFNLKSDHHFNWRHNPHARLASILKLAIHHYDFTKKRNEQEANLFLNNFLTKTVGAPKIYAIIKKNFAYPGVLDYLLEIMKRCEPGQFPILQRDLEAVKRLYTQYIAKSSKVPSQYNLYYQENLQDIQHNRVMAPYYQDLYSIAGLPALTGQGAIHQAMRRFYTEKEALMMEIETFSKFHKEGTVKVTMNYFEYPHIADLKIITKDEEIVLIFSMPKPEKEDFLGLKQFEMQQQSETYWKKRGFKIFLIQSPEDVERFMNTKIKKLKTHQKPIV